MKEKIMVIKEKNRLWKPAVAFSIPVIVMLSVYACLGIFPWGDHAILTIDLNNQYISFFSYLREMLSGERGFFYSFSKILGGDMAGLNAYYLMSPLNLLLLPFSREQLPIAIELITLIKLGLCGLTFFLCITGNRRWQGLIFSTAYALMAYNIVYQQNIMWLDSVMLLPVVARGICRITEGKAPFLYLISLFGAIVTNYYIGFMICIFSVLFFCYQYACAGKDNRWKLSVLLRYGAASLLGGGLAMWIILPALKSLSGGKAVFDLSLLTMTKVFPLRDFLLKFFIGSFDYGQVVTGQPENYIPLPNIYCGMITLFFAGLFFINKKIERRKKIGAILLLLVLVLSFYLKGLNMVWHGFNEPVWFPYRFSFLFSFMLLYIAWEGFRAGECSSLVYKCVSLAAVVVALLAAVLITKGRPYDFLSTEKYIFSIVSLTAGGFLYLLYSWKKKAAFATCLLVLSCAELWVNGLISLQNYYYTDYTAYKEFLREAEPAVEYVKNTDDSFYRMEKTFYRNESDPMMLDYNGLSHYSSTEKTQIKYFMGQMGFRNNGNWAYYNRGSSYAADSLLGIKYICSKTELEEPYQLLDMVGDVGVYKNPYALGIGFMADESVLEVSIDNPHKFQLQNELWEALDNRTERNLFCPEELSAAKLVNLQQTPESPYTYKKVDKNKLGAVIYTFKAESDDPVFAWFGSEAMHGAKIRVNGKDVGRYFEVRNYDILRLGSFRKGEEVTVQILPLTDTLSLTDTWIYYQDMSAFKEFYDSISPGQLNLEKASDVLLKGTVENNTGKEYMFFTIPADPGWHIYVDGEEVPVENAMEIFMAAKIPEGTHEVELRFVAPGLKAGIAIGALSCLICVVWAILYRKHVHS